MKVDRAATARYGINVADISDLIRTGIGGEAVSQVFIEEAALRHYGSLSPGSRDSPEAIGDLVLTSSNGALILVSQVAQVMLQAGESTITREMNHGI